MQKFRVLRQADPHEKIKVFNLMDDSAPVSTGELQPYNQPTDHVANTGQPIFAQGYNFPNYDYMTALNGVNFIPAENIPLVGVSIEQSQRLNYEYEMARIEIAKASARNQMRIEEYREKRLIDYAISIKRKELQPVTCEDTLTNNTTDVIFKGNTSNDALIQGFIQERLIVKLRQKNTTRNKFFFMKYDSDAFRHVVYEEADMRLDFQEYCYELDGKDLTNADTNMLFHKLKHAIPLPENSGLTVLEDHQIMFSNGYFDISEDRFYPTNPKGYYNKFSMNYEYIEKAEEPKVFDLMLNVIFENDQELVHLAYQYIGALLSPKQLLKKVYVFQGKSNGGKSRLANIITDLIGKFDCLETPDLADITQPQMRNELDAARLIHIKDAADKAITKKQMSYIKSLADGNDSLYKILLCTNHKLFSGDDGRLEAALINRIVVLPFAKPMPTDNDEINNFELKYLPTEKYGIVRKALHAFSEVLNNGGRFSISTPVNECIEDDSVDAEDTSLCSMQTMCSDDDKVKSILEELFEPTEETDKMMTMEEILDIARKEYPDFSMTKPVLGKALKNCFGEEMIVKRNGSGKLYALREHNT